MIAVLNANHLSLQQLGWPKRVLKHFALPQRYFRGFRKQKKTITTESCRGKVGKRLRGRVKIVLNFHFVGPKFRKWRVKRRAGVGFVFPLFLFFFPQRGKPVEHCLYTLVRDGTQGRWRKVGRLVFTLNFGILFCKLIRQPKVKSREYLSPLREQGEGLHHIHPFHCFRCALECCIWWLYYLWFFPRIGFHSCSKKKSSSCCEWRVLVDVIEWFFRQKFHKMKRQMVKQNGWLHSFFQLLTKKKRLRHAIAFQLKCNP